MSRLIRAQERGGGVSPITPISETAEPIFTIQTEFDSPEGELSCGLWPNSIVLGATDDVTSEVSKVRILAVNRPAVKCAILANLSIEHCSSESCK